MKLWNVTAAVSLGALFAFGCTVEESSPTTDGGTTTDAAKTDTGTAATDTGTAATDTGTATTDGGGGDCATCQMTQCSAEQAACQADMTKLKGCNDLITCINACTDAACANKCISDSPSTEGKALMQCVIDKCAAACGG